LGVSCSGTSLCFVPRCPKYPEHLGVPNLPKFPTEDAQCNQWIQPIRKQKHSINSIERELSSQLIHFIATKWITIFVMQNCLKDMNLIKSIHLWIHTTYYYNVAITEGQTCFYWMMLAFCVIQTNYFQCSTKQVWCLLYIVLVCSTCNMSKIYKLVFFFQHCAGICPSSYLFIPNKSLIQMHNF
jgi:hypothetical protein